MVTKDLADASIIVPSPPPALVIVIVADDGEDPPRAYVKVCCPAPTTVLTPGL